jgi:hypothetical protein
MNSMLTASLVPRGEFTSCLMAVSMKKRVASGWKNTRNSALRLQCG